MTASRDHAQIAPVLLGALLGAMVAGRLETGALCVGVAALAARAVGARAPSRAWWSVLGSSLAIALLLNLYLVPGHLIAGLSVWKLHATREGLKLGALLGLRLTGALTALHGLRSAWPGERAADEGARLLEPLERLRVPVAELRVMLGLALRFAPLLASEARRIGRIQELRAGGPPRNLRGRLERARAAVIPTLISALERAERVALALEARHYRARPVLRPQGGSWTWRIAGLGLAGTALVWRAG